MLLLEISEKILTQENSLKRVKEGVGCFLETSSTLPDLRLAHNQ